MDQQRHLIIGASGGVGERLYRALGRRQAVATYCRTALAGGVHFDSTAMRLRDTVLRGGGFTHAFVLFGVTAIDACARDPQGASRVNVESMRHVIDDLLEQGVVPLFVSSDAVFDGTRGNLRETDLPHPILTYGRQKLEIEAYLAERAPDALVVRLAKVVGTADARSDMLAQWLDALDAGGPIRCSRDQTFTPIHVDDAVRALVDLASGAHRGVFHAGGRDTVTRLALLEMLMREAEPYIETSAEIIECDLNDLPFAEARPLDTSLCSEKLYRALGWTPMSMRDACRRAVLAHYGASMREASPVKPVRMAGIGSGRRGDAT